MTHLELKELLKSRIGWEQYPTDFSIILDAENITSDSGRYFNTSEHPFVTLNNLFWTIEIENASDVQFNAHLKRIRDQVILLVLSDVFIVTDIQDDVLTNNVSLFDNAISKRMAIVVGETIITSTQSNYVEQVNKEQQQKIFFELNGNSDSASARANSNFPTYIGLKSRYGAEIKKVKDFLDQEPSLDVLTMRVPNYDNDETSTTLL